MAIDNNLISKNPFSKFLPDEDEKEQQATATSFKQKMVLHITCVKQSNYPRVEAIASRWKKEALLKEEDTSDPDDRHRFNSCRYLASRIEEDLSYSFYSIYDVYLCEDERETPRGIMLLTRTDRVLFLSWLVVNPENLLSPVGAGTALVREAEKQALFHHCSMVKLMPLLEAESFYEKLGYVKDGFYMQKTAEKIGKEIVERSLLAAA